MTKADEDSAVAISGRCYCGGTTLSSSQPPQVVAYCHCDDCRRATGGPVAAFAAFDVNAVTFTPDAGRKVSINPGVTRSFCATCGSSVGGWYDYLPGEVYISLGILDQANEFAPQVHTHEDERLVWLHIEDDLERFGSTFSASRNRLTDPFG